ncbi:hypothetical protein GQ42DRAFT_29773 [Ramicandelaber brevisporus]|nr:hypothetical protein GQ42DRAFT_29773 [Ramicandelaber brevisporus]
MKRFLTRDKPSSSQQAQQSKEQSVQSAHQHQQQQQQQQQQHQQQQQRSLPLYKVAASSPPVTPTTSSNSRAMHMVSSPSKDTKRHDASRMHASNMMTAAAAAPPAPGGTTMQGNYGAVNSLVTPKYQAGTAVATSPSSANYAAGAAGARSPHNHPSRQLSQSRSQNHHQQQQQQQQQQPQNRDDPAERALFAPTSTMLAASQYMIERQRPVPGSVPPPVPPKLSKQSHQSASVKTSHAQTNSSHKSPTQPSSHSHSHSPPPPPYPGHSTTMQAPSIAAAFTQPQAQPRSQSHQQQQQQQQQQQYAIAAATAAAYNQQVAASAAQIAYSQQYGAYQMYNAMAYQQQAQQQQQQQQAYAMQTSVPAYTGYPAYAPQTTSATVAATNPLDQIYARLQAAQWHTSTQSAAISHQMARNQYMAQHAEAVQQTQHHQPALAPATAAAAAAATAAAVVQIQQQASIQSSSASPVTSAAQSKLPSTSPTVSSNSHGRSPSSVTVVSRFWRPPPRYPQQALLDCSMPIFRPMLLYSSPNGVKYRSKARGPRGRRRPMLPLLVIPGSIWQYPTGTIDPRKDLPPISSKAAAAASVATAAANSGMMLLAMPFSPSGSSSSATGTATTTTVSSPTYTTPVPQPAVSLLKSMNSTEYVTSPGATPVWQSAPLGPIPMQRTGSKPLLVPSQPAVSSNVDLASAATTVTKQETKLNDYDALLQSIGTSSRSNATSAGRNNDSDEGSKLNSKPIARPKRTRMKIQQRIGSDIKSIYEIGNNLDELDGLSITETDNRPLTAIDNASIIPVRSLYMVDSASLFDDLENELDSVASNKTTGTTGTTSAAGIGTGIGTGTGTGTASATRGNNALHAAQAEATNVSNQIEKALLDIDAEMDMLMSSGPTAAAVKKSSSSPPPAVKLSNGNVQAAARSGSNTSSDSVATVNIPVHTLPSSINITTTTTTTTTSTLMQSTVAQQQSSTDPAVDSQLHRQASMFGSSRRKQIPRTLDNVSTQSPSASPPHPVPSRSPVLANQQTVASSAASMMARVPPTPTRSEFSQPSSPATSVVPPRKDSLLHIQSTSSPSSSSSPQSLPAVPSKSLHQQQQKQQQHQQQQQQYRKQAGPHKVSTSNVAADDDIQVDNSDSGSNSSPLRQPISPRHHRLGSNNSATYNQHSLLGPGAFIDGKSAVVVDPAAPILATSSASASASPNNAAQSQSVAAQFGKSVTSGFKKLRNITTNKKTLPSQTITMDRSVTSFDGPIASNSNNNSNNNSTPNEMARALTIHINESRPSLSNSTRSLTATGRASSDEGKRQVMLASASVQMSKINSAVRKIVSNALKTGSIKKNDSTSSPPIISEPRVLSPIPAISPLPPQLPPLDSVTPLVPPSLPQSASTASRSISKPILRLNGTPTNELRSGVKLITIDEANQRYNKYKNVNSNSSSNNNKQQRRLSKVVPDSYYHPAPFLTIAQIKSQNEIKSLAKQHQHSDSNNGTNITTNNNGNNNNGNTINGHSVNSSSSTVNTAVAVMQAGSKRRQSRRSYIVHHNQPANKDASTVAKPKKRMSKQLQPPMPSRISIDGKWMKRVSKIGVQSPLQKQIPLPGSQPPASSVNPLPKAARRLSRRMLMEQGVWPGYAPGESIPPVPPMPSDSQLANLASSLKSPPMNDSALPQQQQQQQQHQQHVQQLEATVSSADAKAAMESWDVLDDRSTVSNWSIRSTNSSNSSSATRRSLRRKTTLLNPKSPQLANVSLPSTAAAQSSDGFTEQQLQDIIATITRNLLLKEGLSNERASVLGTAMVGDVLHTMKKERDFERRASMQILQDRDKVRAALSAVAASQSPSNNANADADASAQSPSSVDNSGFSALTAPFDPKAAMAQESSRSVQKEQPALIQATFTPSMAIDQRVLRARSPPNSHRRLADSTDSIANIDGALLSSPPPPPSLPLKSAASDAPSTTTGNDNVDLDEDDEEERRKRIMFLSPTLRNKAISSWDDDELEPESDSDETDSDSDSSNDESDSDVDDEPEQQQQQQQQQQEEAEAEVPEVTVETSNSNNNLNIHVVSSTSDEHNLDTTSESTSASASASVSTSTSRGIELGTESHSPEPQSTSVDDIDLTPPVLVTDDTPLTRSRSVSPSVAEDQQSPPPPPPKSPSPPPPPPKSPTPPIPQPVRAPSPTPTVRSILVRRDEYGARIMSSARSMMSTSSLRSVRFDPVPPRIHRIFNDVIAEMEHDLGAEDSEIEQSSMVEEYDEAYEDEYSDEDDDYDDEYDEEDDYYDEEDDDGEEYDDEDGEFDDDEDEYEEEDEDVEYEYVTDSEQEDEDDEDDEDENENENEVDNEAEPQSFDLSTSPLPAISTIKSTTAPISV